MSVKIKIVRKLPVVVAVYENNFDAADFHKAYQFTENYRRHHNSNMVFLVSDVRRLKVPLNTGELAKLLASKDPGYPAHSSVIPIDIDDESTTTPALLRYIINKNQRVSVPTFPDLKPGQRFACTMHQCSQGDLSRLKTCIAETLDTRDILMFNKMYGDSNDDDNTDDADDSRDNDHNDVKDTRTG